MTSQLIVSCEQAGKAFELEPGLYPGEFDEGPVLLTFHAKLRPLVELDDQRVAVSWRERELVAACNFDLTNQVGYHRICVRVGSQVFKFDFHTSTAKATRDEVLAMAEVCAHHYLGFRRQFIYVAANGEQRKVLLPQIHFAWLRDRAGEIFELVRSMNVRPAVSPARQVRPSTRAKGMSLPHTIRLLHERPRLLEEREDGPIIIDEKRYWPAQIMESIRVHQPSGIEHGTIARFLQLLIDDCISLKTQVDMSLRVEIDKISAGLSNALSLPIFRSSRRRTKGAVPALALPTAVERSDSRYSRMRILRIEYMSDIGSTVDYDRSIRANVKDISEIYQTFVAHVVGNALGLKYCSSTQNLRDRDTDGASMRSLDWILGFDVKPPGSLLTSWRGSTARPAGERPDVSLVSSTVENSILFDAKFKVAKVASKATQEDLFEMQSYMNSFSIPQGGIIFPGSLPVATIIEAGSNRLVELPIRAEFFARLGGASGMHSYVHSAIENSIRPMRP